MLENIFFVVNEKVQLPVYENSTIRVLRVNENYSFDEFIKDTMLVVCDCGLIAKQLFEKGYNVIALLNEENNGQDFSFCKYAIMDPAMCEPEFFEGVLKRFLGLPWDILETKRCLIRETTVADVDVFYQLYSDKEITEYMEPLFVDVQEEIEYTKSYIKNVYEFYGFGMWTVVEKNTGEIIGRAGVSYREGYELPELGFMIGKKYWRQGYAYEVCCAILDYMHENYDMGEIIIFIEPQNTPSIYLAKKLGANFYKEKCMGTCDAYVMRLPRLKP